jgi:hypothetical protein
MVRLLYENSDSYKGHLIIPFAISIVDGQTIYSYKLLSELGHKGKLHKLENPSGICSSSLEGIIHVAKEYLEQNSDIVNRIDNFKRRYTYCNNLIIIYQISGKYFYDHYPPDNLNNIAAPRIFTSEAECINWIKQGLDRSRTSQVVEKS